jgi:hypothetical protein
MNSMVNTGRTIAFTHEGNTEETYKKHLLIAKQECQAPFVRAILYDKVNDVVVREWDKVPSWDDLEPYDGRYRSDRFRLSYYHELTLFVAPKMQRLRRTSQMFDNDRKSANDKDFTFKITVPSFDFDFTGLNRAIQESIKTLAMSQEERDRIANDLRWATDPLEIMDKLELFQEFISFILLVLLAMCG